MRFFFTFCLGILVGIGGSFLFLLEKEDIDSFSLLPYFRLNGYTEKSVIIETAQGDSLHFNAAVADTISRRARGLQYIPILAQDEGMWFVFEDEKERVFWMKDTVVPLDIIFVGADFNIVSMAKNVPPCRSVDPQELDCPSYASEKPAQYVFEIPGGFAAEYGIQVGDKIQIQ